jgi:hypothetical protein
MIARAYEASAALRQYSLTPRAVKGRLNGGAIGSEDLQRPQRAAANRIDIPNQPFVLLLA